MKVFLVAGARPNFMKIAPIYRASLAYRDVECQIIHTGQHYDHELSQSFFDELAIPRAYAEALEKAKHATVPPLWDGKAAERIWGVVLGHPSTGSG